MLTRLADEMAAILDGEGDAGDLQAAVRRLAEASEKLHAIGKCLVRPEERLRAEAAYLSVRSTIARALDMLEAIATIQSGAR